MRTLAGASDEMRAVTSVAISPDGKWVVSSEFISLNIWDLATGAQVCRHGECTWGNGHFFFSKQVGLDLL